MKPEVALRRYFCMHVNRHVHMYQLKEWRVSGNERHVVTQKELTLQASGRWDSEEWPWIQAGTRNLTGVVSLQCGLTGFSHLCLPASC